MANIRLNRTAAWPRVTAAEGTAMFSPLSSPQFSGGTDGAGGPGGVSLGGVAQNAQHQGDRLLIGDGPVRLKLSIAGAQHEAGLVFLVNDHSGGEIYIAPAPVGAGHVGEDGAVHLGLGLLAPAHDLNGHFAELHPV